MRRRRRPPRRGWQGRQILASICAGLFLGALAIHFFNTRIRPDIVTIVSDHLSNQISSQICDVVNAELEDEGLTYDTICTVQYDSEGNIAALQTDMARLSLLQNTITTGVAQEFDNDRRAGGGVSGQSAARVDFQRARPYHHSGGADGGQYLRRV